MELLDSGPTTDTRWDRISMVEKGERCKLDLREALASIMRDADALTGNIHVIGAASYARWRGGDDAALRELEALVVQVTQIATTVNFHTANVTKAYDSIYQGAPAAAIEPRLLAG